MKRDTNVTPSERTTAWLRSALAEMPADIRMAYIGGGERDFFFRLVDVDQP